VALRHAKIGEGNNWTGPGRKMEDLGEIAAALIACAWRTAAASFRCFVDAATRKGQQQISDSLGRPACSLLGSSMLHRMLTKISKLGDGTAVGVSRCKAVKI
jgi:hypothetical protein